MSPKTQQLVPKFQSARILAILVAVNDRMPDREDEDAYL